MNARSAARAFGLGRAVYWLWHAPAGAVRKSLAEGGPLEQLRDRRAHGEMIRAAAQLPPQSGPAAADRPELHFLTGKKFWDQTAFCLHTFQAQSGGAGPAVFHDDGSADEATVDRLARLFPAARWRRAEIIEAEIDAFLPAAKFPVLRERRAHYPNLRKLTDVHAGARGWRLVLDSDMLFFRRPDFLLDWLAAPARPLHMLDVQDSYGYPRPLLESLAGAPLPARVNVGLCGLRSETLDWEKLEFWCRRLIEAEGTSYYLEQALTAMLLAGQDRAIAPAEDYLLLPDEDECRSPRAVLHHYVAHSKRGYFRQAWRVALRHRPAP
ncbi:MAG TPA: glycosyl transferase family 2 [Opitutaceae bacterium]|nr:glycosyl transferase family 2 [Opitutaceae bacterium]